MRDTANHSQTTTNEKKRNHTPLFLLLGVGILLVITLKIVRTIQTSVWDGAHHINIVADIPNESGEEDLYIWSIEPETKKVAILQIPSQTYITIPPNYGQYKASAVRKFSYLEKHNPSLVGEAVQNTLGVPIDGVLVRDEHNNDASSIGSFFGFHSFTNQTVVIPLLTERKSNLSMYDLWRLWLFTSQLKKEDLTRKVLDDDTIVTKITLPDNSERLVLEEDRFSHIAPTYFTDQTLLDENKTIEIFNASDTDGLANSLATLIENMGGNVINTDKRDAQDNTVVLSNTNSYTASKIASIVHSHVQLGLPKESRADIVVILGGKGN